MTVAPWFPTVEGLGTSFFIMTLPVELLKAKLNKADSRSTFSALHDAARFFSKSPLAVGAGAFNKEERRGNPEKADLEPPEGRDAFPGVGLLPEPFLATSSSLTRSDARGVREYHTNNTGASVG